MFYIYIIMFKMQVYFIICQLAFTKVNPKLLSFICSYVLILFSNHYKELLVIY